MSQIISKITSILATIMLCGTPCIFLFSLMVGVFIITGEPIRPKLRVDSDIQHLGQL